MSEQERAQTPFHELSEYVALPRLSGLAVSPDGTRLVTSVATMSTDKKKYVSALWAVDSSGNSPAQRLTRSAPGESQPVFLPDGSLLFTSKRPDPDAKDDKDEAPALWLLPARGGEARQVANRPGGIGRVAVARDTGAVFYLADMLPGTATAEDDEKARKDRKDAGVNAILHENYPVRYWDHDLGPDQPHLFAAGTVDPTSGRLGEARDLTPDIDGQVGIEGSLAVSPDGSTVALSWQINDGPASIRSTIVVVDVATGQSRTVADTPGIDYGEPEFSPDGRSLVCSRFNLGSWGAAPDATLWLIDVASGTGRDLLPDFGIWPSGARFSSDGSAVLFTADEQGRLPVFRLALASGAVTRLTSLGAFGDVTETRDGSAVYALRAAIDGSPTPVRLDPTGADQRPDPLALPSPAYRGPLPGDLTEVRTTIGDGTELRAWLVLPEGASPSTPAPLLLWIHGGPLSSWNSWSWRWNPWLMAARGYAVLLPDPALSTGYDQAFIQRGWGNWGDPTFADLMAITDAACERPDIDESRTGAMGGSFGGYMANWVLTHTDRFKAVVTHASLWNLDNFIGVTDMASYWQLEFGDPLRQPERYEANSPHRHIDKVTSPVLVIHGDKDYRVPISEALRLWYDLKARGAEAKFLYFPDENHWVLTPGHAKVWYETVHAFLAAHVLDGKWERPSLL